MDRLTYTCMNIPVVGWMYGAKIAGGGAGKVRHANLRSDARGLSATSANCPLLVGLRGELFGAE